METVIIRKSKEDIINTSGLVGMIVIIPLIWFVYMAVTAHDIVEMWIFVTFIFFFLLIPLEGLLVYKMEYKAQMLLSKDGLILSPGSGAYRSMAVMKKFFRAPDKIVRWENITDISLASERKIITGGGEQADYTARIDFLQIKNDAGKIETAYKVTGLDKDPQEILALCRKFQETYGKS